MRSVDLRLGLGAAVLAIQAAGACAVPDTGSIALVLSLPPEGDLRPTGMATVAIGVTDAAGVEQVTTTPLDDMAFSAGDVARGEPIGLRVELRDNANRVVGYGVVEHAIVPDRTDQTIEIPVRKPLVYVSSERAVGTLDPTLDVLNPRFQGAIAATTGALAFPLDGAELAIVTGGSLQRFTTADHQPIGAPIELGVTAVTSAARVPGQRRVVLASAGGIVVVDVDRGTSVPVATGQPPDRVAVGGSAEVGFAVYGLYDRVAPPSGTAACTGTSRVVAYDLAGTTEQPTLIAEAPLSDVAAAGDAVFGANPCTGELVRLGAGAPAQVMAVPGAAQLSVEGGRVWIAGTTPSPAGAIGGARIELASVRFDGGDPQRASLPAKAEVMTYDDDAQRELSLNIHADTFVPLDLAVLPGAPYVALIARMNSHRPARYDQLGRKVIPEMNAAVHDLLLADPQTGSIVQRIRARCALELIQRQNAEFPNWSCIALAGAQVPSGGEITPTAVGALLGGQ